MEEIKNIIKECLKDFKVSEDRIILFGSRAKGKYEENSDYDILIIINEDIDNEKKIKISCKITHELADVWVNADIIVKSQNEIKLYENCIGSVVRQALKEGVLV